MVKHGDHIFDPFMGTGTILGKAVDTFGANRLTGLELDPTAFMLSKKHLEGTQATLLNISFDKFNMNNMMAGTKIVSNVPFGTTFPQVPTEKLIEMVHKLPGSQKDATLLISRNQAEKVGSSLRLQKKNVLVLGKQASILYGTY